MPAKKLKFEDAMGRLQETEEPEKLMQELKGLPGRGRAPFGRGHGPV